MAKPKSVKLRSLIMLRTLFKYSDAKHPIGFQEVNDHLRPYSLDCDRRSLNDTIEILKEFGIKVSYRPQKYAGKAWIEESPFSDKDIGCLVFALTTNPDISKTQATNILQKIKPFVTVYQEPLLTNNVTFAKENEADDSLWDVFSVLQDACSTKRKIQYTTNCSKYDKAQKSIAIEQSVPVWFTPRCFYRVGTELFVAGFKRSNIFPHAINLKDIVSVRIPDKPVHIKPEQISASISDILSSVSIPQEHKTVIYEGPITFCCRGRYSHLLCLRFGFPAGSVEKDARSITTYPVGNLTLSSEDLHWLSQIPGFGIRIIGPEAAVGAVRVYYNRSTKNLLDPVFPSISPNTSEQ